MSSVARPSRGAGALVLGIETSCDETGVGIVMNDEGVFYFTQLFLRPRD